MFVWDPKDPDEVDARDHDWTMRLYDEDELAQYDDLIAADPSKVDDVPSTVLMPADTIQSSTFVLPTQTGSPAPLVADSTENTTTRSKIWLSGGVDGTRYEIINHIVTTGGRELDQTIRLKVKTR